MKRICHMLLAAAFLAAGCTKEDNGGNSSLPLLEEEGSLGSFSIVHEPIW